METRATLEEALAASWDRDTLAVYADHLQGEGDPRGELIALDLQIDAHGSSAELSKRRTTLLYTWLGSLVPTDNVHASWVGDSLRFGFVEDLVVDTNDPNATLRLEQVLDSPAGAYVRGMTMTGNPHDLERALGVFAQREHRWLARFAIGLSNPLPTIDAQVARQAFHAMPRLESLVLDRYPAFGPLSHPSIKRLSVRGAAAYTALGDGASFDDVVDLDLDLTTYGAYGYYDDEDIAEEQPPLTLPKVAFPSLRRLNLAKQAQVELEQAYSFVRTFEARAHLTHLTIPQLRNADDHARLVALLRDMPALEVIETARGSYYDPPDIAGIAFVRAPRWPWPTQDQASEQALRIFQPLAKYGDTVRLLEAVIRMEQTYETLPCPAREAWTAFWKFLQALPPDTARPFSARVLAEAVEALPSLMEDGWRELREELTARRPLADDTMLRIEHHAI